jgi:diadenosine tetraphosphatase ApaH/serine/threonine PP2A family protein phosphatase
VEIELEAGPLYLINPGSVGQPRDNDPRAAYAIYTPEERRVELRRVCYQIEVAQAKILRAGLPAALADRLAWGS